MAVKNRKLPTLPQGEGSMDIVTLKGQEYIRFRKMVNGKRKIVYGETPKECMTKMKAVETESNIKKEEEVSFYTGKILFGEALSKWHDTVKKVSLKTRSWDREHHTIENQIKNYNIANLQVQAITSLTIQEHINFLINEKNYSYSTVKKTYEILNQFFNYFYATNINANPMNRVNKPTKNGMGYVDKEIEYFDTEDLHLFIREATRTYSNGKPVYKYGYGFLIMILTICRVGEIMGLRWKNVDIERGQVYIREAISRVIDQKNEPAEGKKHSYKMELTTPKYDSIRTVYMNPECKEYFKIFKEQQSPLDEYEWVFSTNSRTLVSERNLRRCLNNIQEAAQMSVQNSGFHVLRHTGITLMARAGVDEMVVAKIAGQKDLDMIHKIYRHVSEKEKLAATNKIYTVDNLPLFTEDIDS